MRCAAALTLVALAVGCAGGEAPRRVAESEPAPVEAAPAKPTELPASHVLRAPAPVHALAARGDAVAVVFDGAARDLCDPALLWRPTRRSVREVPLGLDCLDYPGEVEILLGPRELYAVARYAPPLEGDTGWDTLTVVPTAGGEPVALARESWSGDAGGTSIGRVALAREGVLYERVGALTEEVLSVRRVAVGRRETPADRGSLPAAPGEEAGLGDEECLSAATDAGVFASCAARPTEVAFIPRAALDTRAPRREPHVLDVSPPRPPVPDGAVVVALESWHDGVRPEAGRLALVRAGPGTVELRFDLELVGRAPERALLVHGSDCTDVWNATDWAWSGDPGRDVAISHVVEIAGPRSVATVRGTVAGLRRGKGAVLVGPLCGDL